MEISNFSRDRTESELNRIRNRYYSGSKIKNLLFKNLKFRPYPDSFCKKLKFFGNGPGTVNLRQRR